MSSHPDADAFVAAILRDPAEVTTRLAFADWLEETGDPPNVAWARFIRLSAEADGHPPGSDERRGLEWRVSELLPQVHATLTLDASQLVGHVEQLWRLLPRPNLTLRLAGYELSRDVIEFVPESVAWENLILALEVRDRHLRIATAAPDDHDLLDKLAFIMNREVIPVRVDAAQVRTAILHCFGQYQTECVTECLYEFPDPAAVVNPAPFPGVRGSA